MSLHISVIRFNNMSFCKNNSSDVHKKDETTASEITDKEIVDDFVKGATEPVSEKKSEPAPKTVSEKKVPKQDTETKKTPKSETTSIKEDKAEIKADKPTSKEDKDKIKEDKDKTKNKKTFKKFINSTISKWQQFLKYKARAIEYTKGTVSGVVTGLGIGSAILSVDWAMKGVARVAKKEANVTMFITEPVKLVTNSFGKVFKGIYHLPNLTIKEIFINTLHSPIDLFMYVKNARTISVAGKILAPLAGGAALAYCLTKSVLKANQKVANIEHAFNSGHAHDLQ